MTEIYSESETRAFRKWCNVQLRHTHTLIMHMHGVRLDATTAVSYTEAVQHYAMYLKMLNLLKCDSITLAATCGCKFGLTRHETCEHTICDTHHIMAMVEDMI